MEDSFKVRVERLFGSGLFETVPKSSFPNSSWSVTDGEVEKREWNRERGAPHPDREDTPCASSFDECFPKDRKRFRHLRKQFDDDLDAGDEEGGEEEEEEDGDDPGKEERDIRASLGLDSTLDHEDEEDEYDKVAVCRENAGERLYMRDINDHGPFLNIHSIVPDLLEDQSEESHHFGKDKDPRADHLAASFRLREDKEALGSSHSLPTCYDGLSSVNSRVKINEGDVNVKPILKRKGDQVDSRPKKHVRFDPGCKDNNDEFDKCQGFLTATQSMETTTAAEASYLSPADSASVPDYIRNPSKYVHYILDTSDRDDDERSNLRAFEDFCNMVKKSNHENFQPESAAELPQSLTFMPQKKANGAEYGTGVNCQDSCKEPMQSVVQSIGIAAGEAQENEACAMEEDDIGSSVLVKSDGSRKPDRQYRSKAHSDDSDL